MSTLRIMLLAVLALNAACGAMAASAAAAAASTAAANSTQQQTTRGHQKRDDDLEQPQSASFWPMVSVDRKDNSSNVGVHVPVVFDMTKNETPDQSKLDLSVLSGLVTVERAKKRQNGTLQGPLTVTVFGIPVYTGVSRSPSARSYSSQLQEVVDRAQRKLITEPTERIAEHTEPGAMREIMNNVRSTNDKLIGSLTSLLGRVSRFLDQQSTTGTGGKSGKPLEHPEYLVPKASFSNSDFQPKGANATQTSNHV